MICAHSFSLDNTLERLESSFYFLGLSGSLLTLPKVWYMTSYFRLFCYFLGPKNAVEIVYVLVQKEPKRIVICPWGGNERA